MKIIILLSVLIFTASSLAAEDVLPATIDETFGFAMHRDVPYVQATLDQEAHPEQMLDIYKPAGASEVPVVLYIHGGGWAFGGKGDVNLKPHFFTANGFAFVSMNYRLRWEHKVYDQLTDVVSAIRWIERHSKPYGLDGKRIVLIGNQSGGHLAALAISDPAYLAAAQMRNTSIKAVVSIDSISYDIPRVMRELGSFLERRQHQLIFGNDESVWTAASPIAHIEGKRAMPAFALLHDPEREAIVLQAKAFAKKLSDAGTTVIMIPGSKADPGRTDELLGTANNVATVALMTFLRSQI